jgi:multicomponent Na+:H+ antiporter subunit E
MTDAPDKAGSGGRWDQLSGLLLRLVSMALLWVVLVQGEVAESWTVGLPTVLVAVMASYRLTPRPGGRVRVWGTLRFVPYFLWQSLVGGIDVGLRALRPSMPLRPGLVRYELRMRPDVVATVFFVGVISLLPGTLCASLEGDRLEVHVVDRTMAIDAQLAELEAKVARVFGEELAPRAGRDGPP